MILFKILKLELKSKYNGIKFFYVNSVYFYFFYSFSRTPTPLQELPYDKREKQFKKAFGEKADYGSFLHLRKLMQRGIAEKKRESSSHSAGPNPAPPCTSSANANLEIQK